MFGAGLLPAALQVCVERARAWMGVVEAGGGGECMCSRPPTSGVGGCRT